MKQASRYTWQQAVDDTRGRLKAADDHMRPAKDRVRSPADLTDEQVRLIGEARHHIRRARYATEALAEALP
jgi:hypothetical protein